VKEVVRLYFGMVRRLHIHWRRLDPAGLTLLGKRGRQIKRKRCVV
jgi:hypothetical protein